jgi:hypothetical protein
MNRKSSKPLAVTFVASGLWDTIAGAMYLFFVGEGRAVDSPPTHPFYSVFLASFFFCFAYLQFVSSRDIRRYGFVVGCLLLGRAFYVLELYGFMLFANDFPPTFWFTGIVDATFTLLYGLFARRAGLTLRDLFIPLADRRA